MLNCGIRRAAAGTSPHSLNYSSIGKLWAVSNFSWKYKPFFDWGMCQYVKAFDLHQIFV